MLTKDDVLEVFSMFEGYDENDEYFLHLPCGEFCVQLFRSGSLFLDDYVQFSHKLTVTSKSSLENFLLCLGCTLRKEFSPYE